VSRPPSQAGAADGRRPDRLPAKESGWALLLLATGIGLRLLVAARFPTIPISDYRTLVAWGLQMRDGGLVAPGWFWDFFNPGVSAVLSFLFRLFPADPDAVARTATAVATGAVCVLPFLAWRGVFSFRVRILAGLLLAVWPGQLFFSPVVAQDNWVLLSLVGLAVLAPRVLGTGRASPVLAAVLWTASAAIRQEMLLVALPLAAASAGLWPGRRVRRDATFRFVAASVLLLSCLGVLRARATGDFSLSTGHGGKSVLGSWIPGAAGDGWTDPLPFVASVEPDLLRDASALNRGALRLAAREALRRPVFHALRLSGQLGEVLRSGERISLDWSLARPEVLPPFARPSAEGIASLGHVLDAWQGALHVVFFAVLLLAAHRRDRAILVLVAAILLKILIHLVVALQGRYFFPVTALEILAVSVGLGALTNRQDSIRFGAVLAGSAVVLVVLSVAGRKAWVAAIERDTDVPRSYSFILKTWGGKVRLDCRLEHGRLLELDSDGGRMRLEGSDPVPGEETVLACRLIPETAGKRMVVFEAMDEYAPGGLPGRVFQAASVSGGETFLHDIGAEAGTGWNRVVLPSGTSGTLRFVLRAVHPEPGWNWGLASASRFRLRTIP